MKRMNRYKKTNTQANIMTRMKLGARTNRKTKGNSKSKINLKTKGNSKSKMNLKTRMMSAVAAAAAFFVGVAPITAHAGGYECTCEDYKCTEDAINADCELCKIDYTLCCGEELASAEDEDESTYEYGPLTPDGNMNIKDDYGSSSEAGKQFITLTTKSGNYFYIIIDRDDKGTETVHFLNLVDEADLLALMEDEEVESYMNSQGMTAADETSEVETTTEPVTEVPADEAEAHDTENQGKNVTGIMAVVLIVAVGGIGGYLYFKSGKGKKKEPAADPDADYFDDMDDESENLLDDLTDEIEGFSDEMGNLSDEAEDFSDEIDDASDEVEELFTEVEEDV